MIRFSMTLFYFLSVFTLPWWALIVLGVLLIAYYEAYVSVLIGAFLFDTLYGVPMIQLFNFSYLYTAIFVVLVVVAYMLRTRLLE